MEPRIRYAKTKDGVSIAFWTLGAGRACRGGSDMGGRECRQILTPKKG